MLWGLGSVTLRKKNNSLGERMKRSRWFALIPAIAGISLLLLGYYLDAEALKILGLIVAGFVLIFLC